MIKNLVLVLGLFSFVSCASVDKKNQTARDPQQVIVNAGLAAGTENLKFECKAFLAGKGWSTQLVGSAVNDSSNIRIIPVSPNIIGDKPQVAFFIPLADLINEKEMRKRFKIRELPGSEVEFNVSAGPVVESFSTSGSKKVGVFFNAQGHYYRLGKKVITIQGQSQLFKSFDGVKTIPAMIDTGAWPQQDPTLDAFSMSCNVLEM